jgi:hypothetical protein
MTEGQKLIRNSIECAICHDVIESKHRHDFVRCKCGSVFVDGGLSYLNSKIAAIRQLVPDHSPVNAPPILS